MIRHLINKHQWPRKNAVETLESLDEIGLAYIGVEMRERARACAEPRDYDPYANAWGME